MRHRPNRFRSARVRLRDSVFAGGSVLAIMEQPHIPLGLPGYRALMWLGLIVAAGILCGRGWPTFVGAAAAMGTLAIGRSPDGIWGVLQYVIAAVVVDAVVAAWPQVLRHTVKAMALGAGSLVLVGWIAPVGQGFSGGAGVGDLWYALSHLGVTAWSRLIGFDLLFGAGAGLIGVALAEVLALTGVFARRSAPPATGEVAAATPV
jgi:hypothetical protein